MSKAAKPKLTEVEKFYVKSNPDNLDAVTLSKKLKKPADVIQAVLDEAVAEIEEEAKKVESKKKSKDETLFRQNMARPSKKGKHIATAMTGTASEVADISRKKGSINKLKHVYKPYKDE